MNRIKYLVVIFVLVFLPISSFAEVDLKTGAYLRLRHEYWKNIFDQDSSTKDNRNYFRVKSSLWGKLAFSDNVTLYSKLTDEFRAYAYYMQPSGKKRLNFDIDEVVFDNLYLDIKNFLDMPLDLRVGRQDLLFTYGEGFLIMDGTPLDGSRTFYFNSAKATWRIDNINSVDLVYIKSEREDDTLPIINEKTPHQQLNTSDEEAGVLYWKRAPVDNFSLEGYYIFKIENDGGARLQAQKTELNTIGSFAKYTFEPWTLKGQLAYQFGDYGPEDREGLGGYVFVDRTFKDVAWSPEVSGGFIYLSGDEASTSKNEAWDPLFSRWPWMSELYSLSFNGESGLDYWTNLQMWRSSLVLRPTDKTKFSLWYNFLMANETPAGTSFSVDSGKQRGHLPQMRLDYSFNKNINAYILAEYFIPGNFYSDEADSSLFLRTELSFEF